MNLYPIHKRGLFGYIDATGNQTIDFKFKGAKHLIDKFAPVKLIDKWGYIDSQENITIDFKYFFASEFKSGQACVALKANKSFWINHKELRIHPKFKNKAGLSCYVDLNFGKWGFLNSTGEVIDLIYDKTENSSEGLLPQNNITNGDLLTKMLKPFQNSNLIK